MIKSIRLSHISSVPPKKISKQGTSIETIKLIEKLIEMQDKLYAQKKYAVLIILQGMDTSGKDSGVKHVFSGVNPAGCNVKSFKEPTIEEMAHHFLWRVTKECPAKGMIQIFNRSHYEEIIVPKIGRELKDQELKMRCDEINWFEKGLINNDTILLKFYLHISHTEQLNRLNARRTDARKQWKFQKEDVVDIEKHTQYAHAYEFIFKHCSEIPWHIIPSDKKWYKNFCILSTIVNTLEQYDIRYPNVKLKTKHTLA